MDMLNKPFDNFNVALSECRHQDGDLSVVLTINVRTITKEQLAYFQMAPLKKVNILILINDDLKKSMHMFLHHSLRQSEIYSDNNKQELSLIYSFVPETSLSNVVIKKLCLVKITALFSRKATKRKKYWLRYTMSIDTM